MPPRHYWSQTEFAEALGIKYVKTIYQLRKSGWIIDPDVKVGRVVGWDPEQGKAWGIETSRLSSTGKPIGQARQGRPPKEQPEPPAKWRKTPKQYLAANEAARALTIEPMSLWQLRERDSFIEADVEVGDVLGWDLDRVIQFGLQSARITLDEAKKIREDLIRHLNSA